MAREQRGNILQRLSAAHGRRGCQHGARLRGPGERGGLVLGGDGGQNWGLAPTRAPIHQHETNCDVAQALQPRRRDSEGCLERHVQHARLGAHHVDDREIQQREQARERRRKGKCVSLSRESAHRRRSPTACTLRFVCLLSTIKHIVHTLHSPHPFSITSSEQHCKNTPLPPKKDDAQSYIIKNSASGMVSGTPPNYGGRFLSRDPSHHGIRFL